jgi:hypothetical protein
MCRRNCNSHQEVFFRPIHNVPKISSLVLYYLLMSSYDRTTLTIYSRVNLRKREECDLDHLEVFQQYCKAKAHINQHGGALSSIVKSRFFLLQHNFF